MSANTSGMSGCFLASCLRVRSNAAVERTRYAGAMLCALAACRPLVPSSPQLGEEQAGVADATGFGILAARGDLPVHLRIAELEVVLELVGVHDAGDRDAVLLEDEVFSVQMSLLDDRAEVDTGFCNGNAIDHDVGGSQDVLLITAD